MLFEETRQQIADLGRRLERDGLLNHTAGNLSARVAPDRIAISPSNMRYPAIRPEDVVVIDMDGHVVDGDRVPSSEWRMHLTVYQLRPDVGGVVHTHAPYATTLAVMHLPIPAVHYEIAALAEDEIPLVPYATYGTADLAAHLQSAIGTANAALLANHGAITLGPTLEEAATHTEVLEFLAMTYCRSLLLGQPVILPREEILHVRERFRSHGQPRVDTEG